MLSSTSDKAKLFAKNFSKDSDLDDLGIFLPDFLSRTNMKLNNISITPKMVKKVKLVNNRIVDYLEKSGFFSDFQYGFRSSRSTAVLLTVVSDRIARAFNRSGAPQAVALDIYPRLLTEISMQIFFTNLGLMELQVRYLALFLLFSVISVFEWFWM